MIENDRDMFSSADGKKRGLGTLGSVRRRTLSLGSRFPIIPPVMLRYFLTFCTTLTLTLALAQTKPAPKAPVKLGAQDTTQQVQPTEQSAAVSISDSSQRTMTAQRYLSSSMLWAAPEPKKP